MKAWERESRIILSCGFWNAQSLMRRTSVRVLLFKACVVLVAIVLMVTGQTMTEVQYDLAGSSGPAFISALVCSYLSCNILIVIQIMHLTCIHQAPLAARLANIAE